jgi:hypothetical protein
MERYRRKEDVLVWEWKGNHSLVDEINNELKSFNAKYDDYHIKVGIAASDNTILYIGITEGNALSSNSFVRVGEFVVFDIHNQYKPIFCCGEEYLEDTYTRI